MINQIYIVDNKLNIKYDSLINFACLTFTLNGAFKLTKNKICNLLMINTGGREDLASTYGGACGVGAGEVIYCLKSTTPVGSYNIQVGNDLAAPTKRITDIYHTGNDFRERAAIFERTDRGALSLSRTSGAQGFATQESGPCPSARFECCARQHPGHGGHFGKPIQEGMPRLQRD